jgi:hypothetical protein
MPGNFLFLFPLYFRYEFRFVLLKEGVVIVILIFSSFFREAVHIELAYVRVHFIMFEEDGEDNR